MNNIFKNNLILNNKNSMKNINFNIIGYYDHKNIGDEQYKISFESLFLKLFYDLKISYNLNFYDCDKINMVDFEEDDIIILGGGDVLNEYFLDKIISKFKGTTNKIIAMSVGLPFKSVLTDTNKLKIIDYIFLRTKQDIHLFEKYFHQQRILYLPDISFELILNLPKPIERENYQIEEINDGNNESNFNNVYKKLKEIKALKKKVVCLSLNRHICKAKNYEIILNNFTQFIKFLTNFEYYVIFIPFNTNINNQNENDILIHNEIVEKYKKSNKCSDRHLTHLINVDFELTIDQTLLLFNLIDVCVPMRFHACLFSIYKNIPFFPVFTTRKIRNLLVDIDWMHGYELDTDSNYLPRKLDLNILIDRFSLMLCSINNLKNKLEYINLDIFGKEYNNMYKKLTDVLLEKIDRNEQLYSKIEEKINNIYNSVQEFAQMNNFKDFREVTVNELQDIIVSIVSYNLTNGCIISKYNYGLKQKMFNVNYNYKNEWMWIYQNEQNVHETNKLISNSYGIFNLGFVDQKDYSGCHRSGWQYVYENIKYLHNENSDLLLDLYIDRTFHWNKEVNKALKLIPYKKNWIGVIHHTFNTSFSDFNCHVLLETQEFLESLSVCKGLIVLSKYLALKLKNELTKLNLGHIKIICMSHPTEHNVPKFSIQKFLDNKDKKLIHVGGWLRNIYSFYGLRLPETIIRNGVLNVVQQNFKLRKIGLKGKNMTNYYPFDDFKDSLFNGLLNKDYHTLNSNNTELKLGNISNTGNSCINVPMVSCNVSSNVVTLSKKITNNWYKHFFEDTTSKLKTVDIINYTDNNEYDKLLTENIIFINLIDASAINTVIECIVRNTPIVVNKHPAVVELLGENYPLYYQNEIHDQYLLNKQIEHLLSGGFKIKNAHSYLSKMNKNKFMIQNFVYGLINVISDLN